MQVPVSLIQSIERDLGEDAWHPEDCPGSHPAYCTCAVGKARRALRALLSQPTPTAEFRFSAETGEELRPYQAATGDVRARIAAAVMPGWTPEAVDAAYGAYMSDDTTAPPSIADMVPGTTFTRTNSTWKVYKRGAASGRMMVESPEGTIHYLDSIDPSTIRDVVVPT